MGGNILYEEHMTSKKPNRCTVLFALVVFQAISGLAGGIGLVGDPSGANVQLPIGWLTGTPFSSYLIPGLILLLILGVGPLIVSVGLWRKCRWATPAAMAIGIALVIWIVVEIGMIGYIHNPPLQLIYGLLGVGILVLAAVQWYRERMNG